MTHLRASDDNLADFLEPVGAVASKQDIDGLQVTLDSGAKRFTFRPSGNAPEMRCYVEADDSEKAQALLRKGLALIEGYRSTFDE